jgi:hypothetical protein
MRLGKLMESHGGWKWVQEKTEKESLRFSAIITGSCGLLRQQPGVMGTGTSARNLNLRELGHLLRCSRHAKVCLQYLSSLCASAH